MSRRCNSVRMASAPVTRAINTPWRMATDGSGRPRRAPANAGQRPENPAYITIQSALDSALAQREHLRQKKAALAAG